MKRLLLAPLLLLTACAPPAPTDELQAGLSARYQTRDFIETLPNAWLDWVAVDDNFVYVLDTQHNLYLTDGTTPTFQRSGVANIRSAGGRNLWIRDVGNQLLWWAPGTTFDVVRGSNVRDLDGNSSVCLFHQIGSNDLYMTTVWSTQSTKVWSNVSTYKAGSGVDAFIRDTSLNLWHYYVSNATLVDGNVAAFDPVGDGTYVWVVGTDGKLWIERTGQGHGPTPVDSDVFNIQGLDSALVFVESRSASLWREDGSWTARDGVDGNIHSFHATSPYTVWVEGSDGNLWREHLSTALP